MTTLSQLAEEYRAISEETPIAVYPTIERDFLAGAHAVLKCPEVVDGIDALRSAQQYICNHSNSCMRHEVCATSHGLECELAGKALAAFEKLAKEIT